MNFKILRQKVSRVFSRQNKKKDAQQFEQNWSTQRSNFYDFYEEGNNNNNNNVRIRSKEEEVEENKKSKKKRLCF